MAAELGLAARPLEEHDDLENTLVLFASDNGGSAEVVQIGEGEIGAIDRWSSLGGRWANVSNTPFREYKHWVHEGGISTPLIVHWPAQIDGGGRFVREPGHIIDVMATAVDVAGALYPADKTALAGTSLAPTFHDEPLDRTMLFWEHEGNRAVRQGKWKLVARHDQPWELYDLEADRSETNDLTGQHREKVAELTRAYEEWAATHQVRPWPLQQ